ncbi:MAG: cytochrome c3 family protein [Planctomycetota bacterium]
MNENESASPQRPSASAPEDSSLADEVPSWHLLVEGTKWQKFRWFASRAVALLAAFLVLGVAFVGFSGWYTSRSEFCRSCHIMEPYYASWRASNHSDVSCVKCHFAPGVAEKVRGKMLGLVQLATYLSGTESPRPAAEIPDASCLRSGCHETRLLSGRVDFDGIPFDHKPHLERLRRGKKLRCTSCHSQIVQGTHMTVTKSSCFLCHFKDEFFNEGLGACTRCHQIPEEEFDLGGGVKFDHDLAYERGVDCANCHGDLIRGNGAVPLERCTVCHNREDHLDRLDDHVFLHRTHVTEHKVDCIACHLEIEHSLDPHKAHRAASNCAACHPDHHSSEVEMLVGAGAHSISDRPSQMAGARVSCFSCHRTKAVLETGTVLMKASMQTCRACHEESELAGLEAYHRQLKEVTSKLETEVKRVQAALESAELDATRQADLTGRVDELSHDIEFLRAGNDIHNSHYASALVDVLVERLTATCKTLEIEPPEVTLPENPLAKGQEDS